MFANYNYATYICKTKTSDMTTQNATNSQFIIEVSLISPIEKIISQLNNLEFRDCDVKWLDNKLDGFVNFAAKTLGIRGLTPHNEGVKPLYMNSYAYDYYSRYFSQLLDYFKSL